MSAWILKRSLCIVGSVWERLGGYQLGSASPDQVRPGHILEDGGATGDGVSDLQNSACGTPWIDYTRARSDRLGCFILDRPTEVSATGSLLGLGVTLEWGVVSSERHK